MLAERAYNPYLQLLRISIELETFIIISKIKSTAVILQVEHFLDTAS